MYNRFILIVSICLLLSSCNSMLEELGMKSNSYLEELTINLLTTNSGEMTITFDKKREYEIWYHLELLNGSGSNPLGGQQLNVSYQLLDENNCELISGIDTNILTSSQEGSRVSLLDLRDIDTDQKFTLIIEITSPIEPIIEFYSPEIRFSVTRKPGLQLFD